MTAHRDTPKEAVLLLLRAAAGVERRLDRRLSNLRGISFSEYQLIRQLAASPTGAASRVELADAVGLTPSAVTRAIKPLERMGYVTTERSERDARLAMATLTPAGHELLDDAEGAVDEEVETVDLTGDERRQLASLLIRLGGQR